MPHFIIKSRYSHPYGGLGFYATGSRFSYWEQRQLDRLNGKFDLDYPHIRKCARERVEQILKKRLVVKTCGVFEARRDERIYDLLALSPRRIGIIDEHDCGSEYDFTNWCNTQLHPSGAYFNAVHIIIDDHLLATNDHWNLHIKNWSDEVLSRLKQASDICIRQIYPIYEADITERKQAERERRAKQETQRQMNTKAVERIEESNIKMAVDDLDRYILGHEGLA